MSVLNTNYTSIDLFSFRHLRDIQNVLSYIPKSYILEFLDIKINYIEMSEELQYEGFTDEVFNKLNIKEEEIFLLLAKYVITPNILLILQELLTEQTKADYDFFRITLDDMSNHRSNAINNLFIFSSSSNIDIMSIANAIYLLKNIDISTFTEELNYFITNNALDSIPDVLEIRDLGVHRIQEYVNFYNSYNELINSIRSPKYMQGTSTYYSLPIIEYKDSITYSEMKPDYVYQIANENFINFISLKLDFITENYENDNLSENDKYLLNNYLFTIDNAINKFIKDRVYYIECYINENDINDVNSRKAEIQEMIYTVNPKIQSLLTVTDIDNTENIIYKLTESDVLISTFINNSNLISAIKEKDV